MAVENQILIIVVSAAVAVAVTLIVEFLRPDIC